MKTYKYSGPVYIFDRCVKSNVEKITRAKTLRQAINNISFRVKKELGRTPNSKIYLPECFFSVIEDPDGATDGEQLRMEIF